MKLTRSRSIKEILGWVMVVSTTILSLVGGLQFILKRWQDRLPSVLPILPPDLTELVGLSDQEAVQRRTYDPEEEQKRARKQINREILRRNIISIFNISLLGLAVATLLLGDWLGGLTTLGVMLANIAVNSIQQAYAVHNVEKIAAESRPKVNAIRSGKGKSLRVDEIVVGDILVAGLGDQVLADGIIVQTSENLRIHDTVFTEIEQGSPKTADDLLMAGSYCVNGWLAYQVQTLPAEELRTPQNNAIPESSAELTSLQKLIDRILRVLLALTAIFVFLLIQSIMQWDVIPPDVQKLYRDAASIIFSIAPAGLFFMIIVSYNMGTFDLLKLGALVRDSRSVESLSQVSTICFGKSGTLTGIDIQVEMLPQPDDAAALGKSRIRQIIGDFAHNSGSLSHFLTEMRTTFDGQTRPISAESRFLSTYGWCALSFLDPDLKGTYVLGRPDLFQLEVSTKDDNFEDGNEQQGDSVVQKTWGRLRGLFRRRKDEDMEDKPASGEIYDTEGIAKTGQTNPIQEPDPENLQGEAKGLFGRMRKRLTGLVRRETPAGHPSPESQEAITESSRLVFSYQPEEVMLFDPAGRPVLPENLIPLSTLTFTEQVRPEAKEAIEIFTDAGVQIKIIAMQNARKVVAAAQQLGLEETQPGGFKTLSGAEIEDLPPEERSQALKEATIFAPVTPEQKGDIITSLREGGEYIAMIGEGLTDIEAMQQANLSIAVQGSTQAAVSFADIILLKDSLKALPLVLRQGRRIVNGLIDVLKLNLVQVAYIFFLLVAMVILQNKIFFYDPAQGGLIVVFSVVIPSMGLTFWAKSGEVSEERIFSQLLRFFIPMGLTSALASLMIFLIFNNLTGDRSYAQLGVTYTLTLTGMLMVLFIQPPNKLWVGESPLRADKRFVWMVLVMVFLFVVVLIIPLAQELLKVAPLQESDHYLIIAGVVLGWILITKLIWYLPGMRLPK